MSAEYKAWCLLGEHIGKAIAQVEEGMRISGSLDTPETKLNESAKAYCRKQVEEHKEAIKILRQYHLDVTDKKWETIKRDCGE